MKKLLEVLKAKDPACYEDIRRRVIIDVDEDFEIYASNQTYGENVDDTIVGCVSRGIAARGWNYYVGIDGNDFDQETGERLPGAGIWNNENLDEAWAGDSPAKAILTAYLAAIEAQP